MIRHRLQMTGFFALAALGMYFAVSVAASAVMLMFPIQYPDAWANMTLYLIGFGLPCAIYGVLLKYRFDQPLRETFSISLLPLPSVLLCFLLGLLIQPVTALIAQLSSMVFTDITSAAITAQTSMPLPLLIFSMAILPAFFEEILCRGVLYNGCKNAPVWYQLVIPAVFFGLLHMNFQQISYALPMGIFLAVVLYITGSIFSTMIIHFTLNGMQVTISWLNETLGWFERGKPLEDLWGTFCCGSDNLLITASIALGSAVVIVLILLLLKKIRSSRSALVTAPEPTFRGISRWHTGAWILYMIFGFLFICALLMELMMPFISQVL